MASQTNAPDLRTNRLLAETSADDFAALEPHFEHMHVKQYEEILETGAPVEHAYFSLGALFSNVNDIDCGERTVEVGAVGIEGMNGLPLVFGVPISPHRTVAQIGGYAARIAARELVPLMASRPAIDKLLRRYAYVSTVAAAQIIACNAVHHLSERLARWLLTSSDSVQSNELELTQEFLSHMLGVLRPAVSVAAKELSDVGVISYVRGCITILDRDGLRARSCACYDVMKDAYDAVFGAPMSDPGRNAKAYANVEGNGGLRRA